MDEIDVFLHFLNLPLIFEHLVKKYTDGVFILLYICESFDKANKVHILKT